MIPIPLRSAVLMRATRNPCERSTASAASDGSNIR
jgi:hypothetical protein